MEHLIFYSFWEELIHSVRMDSNPNARKYSFKYVHGKVYDTHHWMLDIMDEELHRKVFLCRMSFNNDENICDQESQFHRACKQQLLLYGLRMCTDMTQDIIDMEAEREANIRKDDFDRQKPFTTSPINGTIRNHKPS